MKNKFLSVTSPADLRRDRVRPLQGVATSVLVALLQHSRLSAATSAGGDFVVQGTVGGPRVTSAAGDFTLRGEIPATTPPRSQGGDFSLTLSSDSLSSLTVPPSGLVPEFRIERAGTEIILSWPGDAADWSIESAPALTPATQWSNAFGSPVLSEGRWRVRLPVQTGPMFFRLIR